ncbi:putative methyltransferase family protein [Abeliophyllum distichum]|uniref:Methyltransferase family protein n=1 Tax=Abeliophyllum distichum TaxID=126358 RepID=A0ABD1NX96_9LAMI
MEREGGEDDEIVCLDESFFINDNYQLTTFTFGAQVIDLHCLQSASTDFDLTGQLVWPGAVLLNDYLSKNAEMLQGRSIIELGSGVGITGILCSRFCREVVLTDHNEEVLKILKKNIELHESSQNSLCCAELKAEKLEWGNSDQLNCILQGHPKGFDLVLGADIYIQICTIHQLVLYACFIVCNCFQQSSIPLLFDTVEKLLGVAREKKCKFILAYVSRAKVMDTLVISEAIRHGLQINEVTGTQAVVKNLEGVVFEVTLG